ncbi:hypothetical protein ACR78H_07420 [Sphingobacterium siyangense]|uniref:hypothetical protein n=1 Tax=Sphingobacterium siyangense TaxID=459529 RepID=UPI003DA2B169
MKSTFLLVVICSLCLSSFSQEVDTTKSLDGLSALLSYNFSGSKRNGANFTPVINYGWVKEWDVRSGNSKKKWAMEIQPYVGGQINARDSSSYLPGLMLPGIAGLKIDLSYRYRGEQGFSFLVSPLNFGYKLVSNFADSSLTIAQHNVRSSIAIGYADFFMLSAQYTYGWHNSISESAKNFTNVFGKKASDIQYLNIILQTKLANLGNTVPTYLFIEWRGILNGKDYAQFSNNRIISFGIRSDIGFKNTSYSKKKTNFVN